MPVNNALTPMEASFIATNAYFSLKDWIHGTPTAAVETYANVHNRVLGAGDAGKADPKNPNPTLANTAIGRSRLAQVFSGTTGLGTTSGFGYVLQLKHGDRRHAVIATRGTRPELGAPDLLTDLRAAMTGFGDFGPVHKGFKRTFDSVREQLAGSERVAMDADVVHCVGHSLGGAVATLVAAHYKRQGKAVKLYTFGSPRVGALGTHDAIQGEIGKDNIFRVAHDLDPISLVGPFPYIHVNPAPTDENNMTMPSPTGQLFSVANHDMNRYISSVASDINTPWDRARKRAGQVDHDNAVLARWLLHDSNNPGWVQYASAKTLALLFKLFAHALRATSTSVILGLSALDLLAELLMNGLHKMAELGDQVHALLRHAATWAGIEMASGAHFTERILQRILAAMKARLQQLAWLSLATVTRELMPLPLLIAGGWSLAQGLPL